MFNIKTIWVIPWPAQKGNPAIKPDLIGADLSESSEEKKCQSLYCELIRSNKDLGSRSHATFAFMP